MPAPRAGKLSWGRAARARPSRTAGLSLHQGCHESPALAAGVFAPRATVLRGGLACS